MTFQSLADLAALVQRRLTGAPPHLVGIAGGVAVGKTTVANGLARQLQEAGRKVDIVTTDSFLRSNAELDELGISLRKGFPESFHLHALTGVLVGLKEGAKHLELPVYSHVTYDIVSGESTRIDDPDVVIVEGVVAIQPEVVELLDISVYVNADEQDIRAWFVSRFNRLTEFAREDAASFYRPFADMDPSQITALAEATWDGINAVNLREHILPTRERADIVVDKLGDHSIRAIWSGGLPPKLIR